jgi:RNA polymerase sigma factor (sigma-70 family)
MFTSMQELQTAPTQNVNWDDLLPRLILYSLRLIRSRGLEERVSAEDVALAAIERSMKYGGTVDNYSNFIMSIAKNIVIDEARKKWLQEGPLAGEALRIADSSPDVQHELEREELREVLTEALGDVAQGDERLTELAKALLEDPPLTIKEIAARLQVSPGEVYHLKNRLIMRVRKAMA